jgi:hypothetical protein
MHGELAQFENAARQIEKLLAELGPEVHQLDASAMGPDWMARAESIVNSAGALLAGCGPAIPQLKMTPEVCHYRKQLEMMRQVLQQVQPKLQSVSAKLRNEHLRIKRLQGWANSVSMMK